MGGPAAADDLELQPVPARRAGTLPRVAGRLGIVVVAIAIAAAVGVRQAAVHYERPGPAGDVLAHGFSVVGHHDLGGRPAFKMAIQVVGGRWYLYAAPPGAPYTSFCERGGRAGPHNQHHDNGLPHLFHSDHLVYVAHFNAGLRLYDTTDPLYVREVGYFIPPDPDRRFGVFPTALVAQSEDVIVDARGYAYLSDKNQGVYIVRSDAHDG